MKQRAFLQTFVTVPQGLPSHASPSVIPSCYGSLDERLQSMYSGTRLSLYSATNGSIRLGFEHDPGLLTHLQCEAASRWNGYLVNTRFRSGFMLRLR